MSTRITDLWRLWHAGATAAVALAVADAAAADVEVLGVEGPLAANVLAYLDLDEEPCDAPRVRVEQLYGRAPPRIRDALQAFGHYEPTVTPELSFADACWHARFTIAAGEPVRIRTLQLGLTGAAEVDPPFVTTLAQAGLEVGDPLDHGAYEQLKRRLSDLGRERGYADARFVASRIDVYPEEHAADVALQFDSGVRYSFGRTELTQEVLTEDLASSYVTFREGEPYDARQLVDVYAALADSGYFRTIDVRPLPADPATHTIPIGVTLTSAPRTQTSYGIGYSTDTKLRLRFGRNNRRFNDRGHQFGVNVQLSPVISEVRANYRLPINSSRSEWLNLDAGVEVEDTESAQSDIFEIGARRVRERTSEWTRTQMLALRVEDFEVADQASRARLLMPGVSWTRIRADNAIRPTIGSKLVFEVRGALDAIFSDTTFAQTTALGKWIWSTKRGQRILVRGQAGATAESEFEELPASVRFFAGGDNSVRGYAFEELGPVDAEGKVIGGSSLATGSVEFEQPLRARWSLAFFVDSGNAFERSKMDAKTSVGLGGRWQSPLGPIRLDLALPLEEDHDSWRVHITLGPDL
ncbi:MAG TPA: autotransporter assembly complex family protein [Gammaproteobacteria bacterium]|nr:autotransporter assembly complex family protein [Gammaproteobacteria bacterium]